MVQVQLGDSAAGYVAADRPLAADAYARLRAVQPVPWGAFLDFGGFALLSGLLSLGCHVWLEAPVTLSGFDWLLLSLMKGLINPRRRLDQVRQLRPLLCILQHNGLGAMNRLDTQMHLVDGLDCT